MNKEPRYITVTFEINDDVAFEPLSEQLRELLLTDGEVPYRIVAMGLGNEFDRIELIEQVVQDEGGRIGDRFYQVKAIEEILALPHENTYELGLEVIRSWGEDE